MPAHKAPKDPDIFLPTWLDTKKLEALFNDMNENANACFISIIKGCLQNKIIDSNAVAGVIQNFLLVYQNNAHEDIKGNPLYFLKLFTDGSLNEDVIKEELKKDENIIDIDSLINDAFFYLRAMAVNFVPVAEEEIMLQKSRVQGLQYVTATLEEVKMPEPLKVERIEMPAAPAAPQAVKIEPMQVPKSERLVPFSGPVPQRAELIPGQAVPHNDSVAEMPKSAPPVAAQEDFPVDWPVESPKLNEHLGVGVRDLIELFNGKPNQIIRNLKRKYPELKSESITYEALDKAELSETDAKMVGEFLFQQKAELDFTKLGDFLSEPGNKGTLTAFVNQIDFSNLNFIDAFRDYFKNYFMLPGEGQKIDRLVNAFAKRFASQHGIEEAKAEQLGILSFAMMALNTDLHNPNQKAKMTKEQFIKNTWPSVQLYSKDELGEIYDNISKTPLPLPVQVENQNKGAKAQDSAVKTNFFSLSIKSKIEAVGAILQLSRILAGKKADAIKAFENGLPEELKQNCKIKIKRPFWLNMIGKAATIILKKDDGSETKVKVFTPNWLGNLLGKKEGLVTPQASFINGEFTKHAIDTEPVGQLEKMNSAQDQVGAVLESGKKAGAKALAKVVPVVAPGVAGKRLKKEPEKQQGKSPKAPRPE